MKYIRRSKRKPRFTEGQVVRVKPGKTISGLNGLSHVLDGCEFMEQMWDYCGESHHISRVVHSLFNEHLKRTVRPRAPLYILDELRCDGNQGSFEHRCDHACLILWHEDWLEPADIEYL
jgi:hypothetical protein